MTETTTQSRMVELSEKLEDVLHERQRVLICLPHVEKKLLDQTLVSAVRAVGAIPVVIAEDLRWSTMLRKAFSNRVTAIISTPLITLGLTKVARATNTPLYIRGAVLLEKCRPWQREGIGRGLDCRIVEWDEPMFYEPAADPDPVLDPLMDQLLSWSSVLDYQVRMTDSGVDLEVVVFLGEKIPGLPTCAKRMIRGWKPEEDVPFLRKTQKIS